MPYKVIIIVLESVFLGINLFLGINMFWVRYHKLYCFIICCSQAILWIKEFIHIAKLH